LKTKKENVGDELSLSAGELIPCDQQSGKERK
jgi:hypothetical protein